MPSEDKKIIVITGASGGIGAELAVELGRQGHGLVLAARREAELSGVASRSGAEALPVVTDVRRRNEVERLRDRAIERLGRIDVWINNAGRGISKRVLEVTDEDFDEMMLVNVKSALYGMQAAVPHFQERGEGHLINVSSFLGRVPLAPQRSAYSAAKAALGSLTTSLRLDLRQEFPRVHISLVMPGIVATEFAGNALGARSAVPPPAGAGPMQPQSVEDAAAAILRLIENPVPEIYTNPILPGLARRYFEEMGGI